MPFIITASYIDPITDEFVTRDFGAFPAPVQFDEFEDAYDYALSMSVDAGDMADRRLFGIRHEDMHDSFA